MDESTELRKEKTELKKNFSKPFLHSLEEIVEKCFATIKTKKEHFITKERVEIELIKLLQSQKRFKRSDTLKETLCLMVCFDDTENMVGKISTMDFETKMVVFDDIFGKRKNKSFQDVSFFDVYSLEMSAFYEKQRRFYDNLNYKQTFSFLTEKKIEKPKGLMRWAVPSTTWSPNITM